MIVKSPIYKRLNHVQINSEIIKVEKLDLISHRYTFAQVYLCSGISFSRVITCWNIILFVYINDTD